MLTHFAGHAEYLFNLVHIKYRLAGQCVLINWITEAVKNYRAWSDSYIIGPARSSPAKRGPNIRRTDIADYRFTT